jgi:hypothetical protein
MAASVPPDPSTWNWLADTFWCVPAANLPALGFDDGDGTLTWRVDQTVWHITGYREGYFWGVSATLLRDAGEAAAERGPASKPMGYSMLGSITPEGRVYLTFVPVSTGSTTTGIGRAVPYRGEWSLEMQMTSGSSGQTMAHWAHMVRVRPGDPEWDSLPGFGGSVPEMLEGLEPPQPKLP